MSWLPGWPWAPGWVRLCSKLCPLVLQQPIPASGDVHKPQCVTPLIFKLCTLFFFSLHQSLNLSCPSWPPTTPTPSGETPPTGHWSRCVHQSSLTTMCPARHGAATQHRASRAPHVLRLSITGPEPTGTPFPSPISQHASLNLPFPSFRPNEIWPHLLGLGPEPLWLQCVFVERGGAG